MKEEFNLSEKREKMMHTLLNNRFSKNDVDMIMSLVEDDDKEFIKRDKDKREKRFRELCNSLFWINEKLTQEEGLKVTKLLREFANGHVEDTDRFCGEKLR